MFNIIGYKATGYTFYVFADCPYVALLIVGQLDAGQLLLRDGL
jgi:hypothetical protein